MTRGTWAAGFDHPVIDSDCHLIEYLPDVVDRIVDLSGRDLARRFERHLWSIDQTHRLPPGPSGRNGITRPPWWNYPARNSVDRATAMLPALLHERLPEIGIDVAVVYPSYFIIYFTFEDDEYRQVALRATNEHVVEMCSGLEDRLLPVASIPMHTPDEAVAELEHCAALGYRAFVLAGAVTRRDGSGRSWLDTTSIETGYDYEPVWRLCEENGWAVTFHAPSMGWSGRESSYNYMHNHVGHFAQACHTIARGLLFSGVVTRHADLRFAFLEGGAGWAASLFADLMSHYAKRNREQIRAYDPANMDRSLMAELFERYASPRVAARLDRLERALVPLSAPMSKVPDDFAALQDGIALDAAGIERMFSTQIFAGCEGDDPLNALLGQANTRLLGTKLNGILGSDIGHWDLPDARELIHETRELVESGHLTESDYRDFVFTNPARLWAGSDRSRGFFAGTVIEPAIDDLYPPVAPGPT